MSAPTVWVPKPATVPCNGCTACCHNDLIFLHAEHGDDASTYLTMPATNPLTGESGLALQKTEHGCIYLDANGGGCTIHGRAPAICRTFDCRKMFAALLSLPRTEQRRVRKVLSKQGLLSDEVIAAAKARLGTLTLAELREPL